MAIDERDLADRDRALPGGSTICGLLDTGERFDFFVEVLKQIACCLVNLFCFLISSRKTIEIGRISTDHRVDQIIPDFLG